MFSFNDTIMFSLLHNVLIHLQLSKPLKPHDLYILRSITFAAEEKGGKKESIATENEELRASQGLPAKSMSTRAGGGKPD